jgi:hypothetical protein
MAPAADITNLVGRQSARHMSHPHMIVEQHV